MTINKAEKDKIMERVKKLLTLSKDDGATEAEAESSARHARKLLDKYNLTMTDIEIGAEGVKELEFIMTTSKMPHWQLVMMNGVTESYDCSFYSVNYPRSRIKSECYIVGAESDVLVVEYYMAYVKDVIYRMSREYASTKRFKAEGHDEHYANAKQWIAEIKPGYMVGMANEISRRLKEMNKDRMEEMAHTEGVTGMKGTEIIHIKKNAVQKRLEEIGVKAKPSRTGRMNSDSIRDGMMAGSKVNLNRSIGGGSNGEQRQLS